MYLSVRQAETDTSCSFLLNSNKNAHDFNSERSFGKKINGLP
ncbi:hypothetical protein LEP1GSC175_2392 [Leptospira santarosai str. HAI821]|nr:hypothetical protein LEP1GSC175_2392 [Leptospira santarosai str. HAI821]EMO86207.1 hypothetical protein LEP1GSC070_2895 [Leptospira santarosai str. AIM]